MLTLPTEPSPRPAVLSYLFIEMECVSSDHVQFSQVCAAAGMAGNETSHFRGFEDWRKGEACEMPQQVKAFVPSLGLTQWKERTDSQEVL